MTKTKKIFILFLILIGSSYFFGNKLIDYFENKPKIVTELNGIHLGEKLSDVLFKNEGYKIDKEEERENYIMYTNDKKTQQFKVENGVVKRIAMICGQSDSMTKFQNIFCNDAGEKVLEKFGKEVKVLCRKKEDEFKDKLRMYDVEKYGVRFGIEYNKVKAFIVTEPNQVFEESSKSWGSCD
jgi:hypothetical protein